MSVGISTTWAPDRANRSGTSVAADCLPSDPWASCLRVLLTVAFSFGVWAALTAWSGTAHAETVTEEPCTTSVETADTSPEPAPTSSSVEPAPEATSSGTVTTEGGAPAPSTCDAPATAPAPAPVDAVVTAPLTGTEILPDAGLAPAPAPIPSAPPAGSGLLGTTSVGTTGALPPGDPSAALVGLPPVTTAPATLDPALDPTSAGLAAATAPTAATVAAPVPCSTPESEPAPVLHGGGTAPGHPGTDGPAGDRTGPADTVSTAGTAADGGTAAGLVDSGAAPLAPANLPPPAPLPAPVLPTAPATPAGPAGPAGSSAASSSGTSCHGAGHDDHLDGIQAVLGARVTAALAQAALRPTAGFSGAVVGGADDPGVRPG